MKTGIFYTSEHGTAEKAATELKKKIGGEVDLIDLKRERGYVENYDNIILGSGIYAGKVSKELKSFIEKNLEEIMKRNHGVYICSREEGDNSKKYFTANFRFDLLQTSFCTAHLGHGIDLQKLGFIKKLLFKKVFQIKEDYTTLNEKEIDIFAKKLKAKINGEDVES
ncbi:flavodoxin [Andreesenia angusta]|uniref:Flavodoxin n=1 Tax=Andreesenia angusta TaxID=39480 RepID=A0A1S1VAL2_9FIRM|nr:flavodoxin domain-containing protein [Andreesenia angusta]OHW63510.1 flavodoxin [Andreesenia angusta]